MNDDIYEDSAPSDEENPFLDDMPEFPPLEIDDIPSMNGYHANGNGHLSSSNAKEQDDSLNNLLGEIKKHQNCQEDLRTLAYKSELQISSLSAIELSQALSALESAGAGVRWVREFRTALSKKKRANAQQGDKPKTTDYIAALSKLGYTFRRNLLDDSIESGEIMLDDYYDAIILNQMSDLGFNGADRVRRVVLQMGQEGNYHPIREYLDGLTWDGQDYIGMLSQKIKDAHPLIKYAGGAERTVTHAFLRRFLIGMVAKVFQQTQNVVIVLTGAQGKGKSTLARWLAGAMAQKYYREGKLDPDSNDHLRSLARTWLWELGEISAITRTKDVNALKNILTQETATYRVPYGRWEVTKTTSTSFIGTVNPDGIGFLRDLTGNRRFACIDVESIDWTYTELDIEQIHAQAYHLYRQGEPWLLSAEEAAARDDNNKQHEVERLIDDCMEALLVLSDDMDLSIHPIDIATGLKTLGYDNNLIKCSMDAATWLKKNGRQKRGRPATWRGVRFRRNNDPATFRGVNEGVDEVDEAKVNEVDEGVDEALIQMQLTNLTNLPNRKKSY